MRCLNIFVLMFLFISCNSQQKINQSDNSPASSAAMQQELQITAKFISSEKTAKKFRITAVVQNETGVTAFSAGDTIFLYPNFLRTEEQLINTKSSENEHMALIRNLMPGNIFKTKIKILGKGNSRYGLIMDWQN